MSSGSGQPARRQWRAELPRAAAGHFSRRETAPPREEEEEQGTTRLDPPAGSTASIVGSGRRRRGHGQPAPRSSACRLGLLAARPRSPASLSVRRWASPSLPHPRSQAGAQRGRFFFFFLLMRLFGWARRVWMAGTPDAGEKNNLFLAETLSKMRFYGSTILSTLLVN